MIRIVADTLANFSVEKANEMGVAYLPQFVIIGDKTFRDDTEINSTQFLHLLKTAKTLPKTAAPPPSLYVPIFEEYSRQGDIIIVICPSQKVSGTYRGAKVAALDFPEADIRVIDTNLIAAPLGTIVIEAVKWAKNGLTADEIIEKICIMSTKMKAFFVLDTLEYLFKGGRIGGAKALVGSLLQVKPILQLQDGQVEPFDTQRTRRRAIQRLKELVFSDCSAGKESHLSVMHGAAEEEAKDLAAEFSQALNLSHIPVLELPPAILVHSGPGIVAVSYFVD
jgi:DegV family protein with EDD domain